MQRYLYFLLIAAAGFVSACGKDEALKPVDEGQPVSVKTAQVVAEATEEPIVYSAAVEAGDRAEIATKVMGRVEAIYVKEGDFVKAGQMLMKIASKDIDAKLAQTEAQIAATTAQYQNAEKNLKRFESLVTQNAATQKEMDDVRLGYEAALAQKKAAEEMKNEVVELSRYVRLTAPFSGVVTAKMVDVGDLTSPGYPVMTVESTGDMIVTASVPESEIGFWQAGMPAKVMIPASSGGNQDQIYEAKITQVVSSADPATHQFKIKAKMTSPDKSIKPGMFARIMVGKSTQKTLMVPKSAVFTRGQLEGIFVVDKDNRARLRWIRTGREMGGYIEVLTGLDSGESVVLDNNSRLKDVQKVQVVNQTTGEAK
ncbi:MAG: efflux RND transporter periplasmic adaptor subunit [Chlorobiales bacterium]|jgi:RND family efflux transporter MFP subunit|nr:efflux RND transporter periplasmic adaptor subunit [Chlorobiales bacterium]